MLRALREDGVLAEEAAQRPHAASASVPTRNVQNVTGIFLRSAAHLPDVLLVVHAR